MSPKLRKDISNNKKTLIAKDTTGRKRQKKTKTNKI